MLFLELEEDGTPIDLEEGTGFIELEESSGATVYVPLPQVNVGGGMRW